MTDSTPSPADDTTPPAAEVPPAAAAAAPSENVYAAPAAPLSSDDDTKFASWAHLGVILPWASFLIPLIVWIVYRGRGPKTNVEGKEALNFGITLTIAHIVNSVLFGILAGVFGPHVTYQNTVYGAVPVAVSLGFGWVFALIEWLIWAALLVVAIVWALKAFNTVKAGGSYKYPFALRLVK